MSEKPKEPQYPEEKHMSEERKESFRKSREWYGYGKNKDRIGEEW